MEQFVVWIHGLMTPAHASEWINGAAGAGGAILGSLVTITWTAWYNRGTRERERREKFAAGAFAAYQRLNQIYSVALRVRDHLEEGQASAKGDGAPTCARTMGMQRMSGPVIFPIEELWTLTQVGGSPLINRVNSLDHSFNNLLDAVDRYGVMREEVWRKVPLPNHMDGNIGTVTFTEADLRRLAPDFGALDHFLAQITPMARDIVSNTFDALRLLVHAKKKPLGEKFKIAIPSPTGETVVIRAEDAPVKRWWQRKQSEEFPPGKPAAVGTTTA